MKQACGSEPEHLTRANHADVVMEAAVAPTAPRTLPARRRYSPHPVADVAKLRRHEIRRLVCAFADAARDQHRRPVALRLLLLIAHRTEELFAFEVTRRSVGRNPGEDGCRQARSRIVADLRAGLKQWAAPGKQVDTFELVHATDALV